jgi:hypothetical protein
MKYISNRSGSVYIPYEDGLLEWLVAHYPFSKYHIVEVSNEMVS